MRMRRFRWCGLSAGLDIVVSFSAFQFPSVLIDMGKELVQYDSRMGHWKGKGESRKFIPLTNFAMKFTKFVRSPEQLPDYAGFIVKVTQPSGKRITEGSVLIHCLHSCSVLALLSMVI